MAQPTKGSGAGRRAASRNHLLGDDVMNMKAVVIAVGTVAALFAGIVVFNRGTPDNGQPAHAAPQNGESSPEIAAEGPHPKAVVDETEFDFGVMQVGEERNHTFVIRNEGDAPLSLTKGDTTCKCTFSHIEGEAIPVGGSTEVELKWRAQTLSDAFEQTADINTNDPDNQVIKLRVKGKVHLLVMVEPPESWNLGAIAELESTEVTGAMYSTILDEFQITGVETSDNSVVAEAVPMTKEELEQRSAKAGYHIRVQVHPDDVAVGAFRKTITLKTDTGEEKDSKFTLYLTGRRTGPLEIVPVGGVPEVKWHPQADVLDLARFSAKTGRQTTLALYVQGGNEQELKLVDTQIDPAFLKVELKPDASFNLLNSEKKRYLLTVQVPPGNPPTRRTREAPAKVTLKTNHPRVGEMNFKVVFISL